MSKKIEAVRTTPKKARNRLVVKDTANLHNVDEECKSRNDLFLTLEFFRNHIGTSLDCAFATGILRNSITLYIRDLEDKGLLRVMYKGADSRTGHTAKHYSANPANWIDNNINSSTNDTNK